MYMKTIAELEKQLTEISEQIKELKNKPKFEVGRWYKYKNAKPLLCYQGGSSAFGINGEEGWEDKKEHWNFKTYPEKWPEATPEEVKAALVKEAEKRYPIGTKFKSLNGINDRFDGHMMKFENGVLLLEDCVNRLEVFSNGQWAEIIKDDVIKVGGYEVEIINDRRVSRLPLTLIDRNEFTKEFWIAAKLISEHSKAKIMVGCSKQFDVSLETINAILAKL